MPYLRDIVSPQKDYLGCPELLRPCWDLYITFSCVKYIANGRS